MGRGAPTLCRQELRFGLESNCPPILRITYCTLASNYYLGNRVCLHTIRPFFACCVTKTCEIKKMRFPGQCFHFPLLGLAPCPRPPVECDSTCFYGTVEFLPFSVKNALSLKNKNQNRKHITKNTERKNVPYLAVAWKSDEILRLAGLNLLLTPWGG